MQWATKPTVMVNLWTKGADKAAVASSLSQSNRLCRPLRHVAPSADSLLDRLLEDGALLAVTAVRENDRVTKVQYGGVHEL